MHNDNQKKIKKDHTSSKKDTPYKNDTTTKNNTSSNITESITLHIDSKSQGQRVDKLLYESLTKVSRNQIQKAIKNNCLFVNDQEMLDQSYKVKLNDKIHITIVENTDSHLVPQNIPLDIVYEDEDIIVVNKSKNLTVHPGAGQNQDTLVNALLYYTQNLSDLGGDIKPGIVHRLDKDTTGLMIVAKNNYAHAEISKQIITRQLIRKYKALVWGMMKPLNGAIYHSLAKSRVDHKKMTVVAHGGKNAITKYKTLEILQKGMFSLVECKLETGRTHQIRVHLSHLGHPIVGDQLYSNNARRIQGSPEILQPILQKMNHQALHSFYISFFHPIKHKQIELEKELPLEYNQLLCDLE